MRFQAFLPDNGTYAIIVQLHLEPHFPVFAAGGPSWEQRRGRRKMIIRLYAGEDGQSHFEDITFPLIADDRGRERAPLQGATGIQFTRFPVGYVSDWHTASRRMYVLILSGQVDCKIGDGTVQRLGPGDVMIEEDLTGQGHSNRVVGDHPVLVAFVRM
jgi:quercetin dioxygenase-like cupin family protein